MHRLHICTTVTCRYESTCTPLPCSRLFLITRARARCWPVVFNAAIVFRPAVFAGYIITSSDYSPHIRQSSMSNPNFYCKINHKDDGACPSPPSYHSHTAPQCELQDKSSHVDGYRSLIEMYLGMAKEEDEKTVKDWKELASDTLIFVSPNIVVHHIA